MNMEEISQGQLVRAKAGRDKGTLFFVTEIINEEYVYIVNGARRKIEAPKKKKIKHLQKCNYVSDTMKKMLENGEKIENAFIRRQFIKHQ